MCAAISSNPGYIRKEAWSRTHKTYKFLFPNLGGSIALGFILHNGFGIDKKWSAIWGIGACLLALGTMFGYQWRKYHVQESRRLDKHNPYGDAIISLNEAFCRVHAARRKEGLVNRADMMLTLTYLCGELQDIFDRRTKVACSLCIKVATDDSIVQRDTNMVTLVRDPRSQRQPKRQKVDNDDDTKHPVFENTCFFDIFDDLGKRDGKVFFHDNLPSFLDYQNTSFDVKGMGGRLPPSLTDVKARDNAWMLPYKSVIVVPISPLHYKHNKDAPLIYGFLCLDSPEPNTFNETYDVAILQGVADGMFDLIHKFALSLNPAPTTKVEETAAPWPQ